jgi:hypothetical protein
MVMDASKLSPTPDSILNSDGVDSIFNSDSILSLDGKRMIKSIFFQRQKVLWFQVAVLREGKVFKVSLCRL